MSQEIVGMPFPQEVKDACENARRLAEYCEALGLGEPKLRSIPALLEQLHHDHVDEPYFWEHGGGLEQDKPDHHED